MLKISRVLITVHSATISEKPSVNCVSRREVERFLLLRTDFRSGFISETAVETMGAARISST
jgi:hypothetical protein